MPPERELLRPAARERRLLVEIHEMDAELRERLAPHRGGLVVVAADGPDDHEAALYEASGQRHQDTHVTDAHG